ncbi:DUF1367 family protein [Flavobacteriaceae bacterium Ap0902]|nr:DUF1367 family protein [Flavobacteriaceae bacterium Ap0902]
MKLFVYKNLNGSFTPCHNSDYEKARKLKPNKEYQVEVKRPRNIKFHRKFFALINMVFENQEHYTNVDHLRKDLTIASGYYDTWFDFNGVEQIEAKSIAFHKMNEDEFAELYNRVLDVIVEKFHFDKELIKENIEQYF